METQTATALSAVAGLADDIYNVQGDDIYVKDAAPYLAGMLHLGISTPKYCQFRQPSLKVPYTFYKSALVAAALRPGYEHMFANPLPLYPREKLNAFVQNASAEYSYIVAWLSSGKAPQSAIDAANPTHRLTGYADVAIVNNVWTKVTPTWDADLPEGKYAVVGMKYGCYLAAGEKPVVARLVLLGCDWRPGVVSDNMGGDKTLIVDEIYTPDQKWPLMPEVSFKHDQMPRLEILSTSADTDHVVELALQKIA